jgi:UDP-GlcNAc:undecaprenyl-phosphate GlcNAc-1-phosphate transferase
LTALLSVLLTPLAGRLAMRVGVVDRPGGRRRVHVREVPRLGGVAIFFPLMAAAGLAFWAITGEQAHLDPQ